MPEKLFSAQLEGKMRGKLISLSGSNMSQEEILPLNEEV
jgi:hypothetical protein